MPSILTLIERAYHQLPGEDPYWLENTYQREYKSDEEPYQYETKLKEDQNQKLELGWVENPGMVIVIPKDAPIVVKYAGSAGFHVDKECPFRFHPEQHNDIFFNTEEKTKITVTVFPHG